MVKKRRRLTKKVKLILCLLLFFTVFSLVIVFIYNGTDNDEKVNGNNKVSEEKKVDSDLVIRDILAYEIGVDELFLQYIYNSYGIDVLVSLKDNLESGTYSDNIWHDITGNSFLVLSDIYNDVINKEITKMQEE